jgi:hypothetical protein
MRTLGAMERPFAGRARMVKLTTVSSAFEGKVLAARLGTEGVMCELRGGVDGPYPFGLVHVYVEEPDLEQARALLADVEPLPADEADLLLAQVFPRKTRTPWLLIAVLLALLAMAGASISRVINDAGARNRVEQQR